MSQARPPASPTIAELREEFARNDVRGWLWGWLLQVLGAYVALRLARRYRAAVYSPTGAWDEAGIGDLVNGFVMQRGIGGNAVLAALQRADNTAGAVAYLERAVHNFAISERVRTISDNIYRRLTDAVAADPELRRLAGIGPRRAAYGDYRWSDDPPAVLTEEELPLAARHMPNDIRTLVYDTGDRLSPVLRTEDLRRIARAVIRGTGRLVTTAQLMRLIQGRFDLTGDGSAALENMSAAETVASSQLDPFDEAVAKDLGRRFVLSLTDRQRSIFRVLHADDPPPSLRAVGRRLGISKSLVQREEKAIGQAIERLHVTAPEEQGQVLAAAAQFL